MSAVGSPIEAVLTLNATGFHSGLNDALQSVKSFVGQINSSEKSLKAFGIAVETIGKNLMDASTDIARFNREAGNMRNFNTFANGVKALATAIQMLGEDASTSAVGTQRIINIIREMESSFSGGTIEVKGLASALRELRLQEESTVSSTQKMDSEFKLAKQDLMNLANAVQPLARVREQADMMKAEFQRARQELMNFAHYGVQAFNQIDATSDRLKAQIESMNAEFERSRAELMEFARYGRSQFGTITAGVQQYESALQVALPTQRQLITNNVELANAERQKSSADRESASSSQQVASAEEKQSVATDRATTSMDRQTTATNRLRKAMSSLRMIGTMVASMMVWNFAHNLITATRETVNAKSEMNGYFQMLGYTSREVDHFNSKLDEMIQKFPRINKYALGETISSIGVEFELTTQEMEKAMPVVSMITSEYLRAGRNVNEASLAVKDILQGEFQRLSRETGVKGDQLKEAGWSGDKTDVMGLLEALDKVGKQRNWDVFVAKANSLNDAVMILQNRFGEWSADMVERVQPAIVGTFNSMMSIAQLFADAIGGVADWLGGEGLGQDIVKWGGLATAISVAYVSLVHYRTGANLVQMAQMGLTKSIGASILGLEAEATAEYGLRTAMISRLTGIEAETVANEGRLASILAVASGLEAEEVATIGKTKVLFASLLGLDTAILKEEGFAVALAHATTQIEAQELASMGLLKQIALIGATTLPAIAVVGAFAVAFGNLAMKTMEATDKMSAFYDIQKNGEQYVKDSKDSIENLKKHIDELKETQKKYGKGTQEYKNVGKAIDDLNGKIELATQNAKDNYEALQIVNSAQENYDTRKQELQLDLQQRINQSLVDTGLSTEEANELSNNYLNDAIDGSEQLYRALQSVALQYEREADGVASLTQYWQDKGLDAQEIKIKLDPYIDAQNNIAKDIEKMKTSTDLIEVTATWLKLQVDQVELTLKENLPKIEAGDWEGGLTGILKGLAHGLAGLPVFGEFWNWVFKYSGAKDKYGGKGWEGLSQFLSDSLWQITNFITSNFDSLVMNPLLALIPDPIPLLAQWLSDTFVGIQDYIMDEWNSFISFDWLSVDGFDFDIWSLFGMDTVSASDGSSDHPSFMEDLSNIIGFDIQTWITNFNADPLGTLGIQLPKIDIMGLISFLIPNTGEGGFDVGGWLSSLFNLDGVISSFTTGLTTIFTTASTIATNVGNIFSNLRTIIWGHITTIISNVTSGFTTVKDNAISKINQLKDGLSGAINKVKDAFISMKDSILDSAKKIMDGVKEKFDSVKSTIGDFWSKLTNPSSWGSAGSESYQRRSPKPQTARRMFSPVVRSATHHGAGVNPYQNDSQTVKLKDLMDMVNGDNKVRLSDFLAMFSQGGFGTWDFHEPVKKKVFDTAKNYKTGSPNIRGIGTVGDGYYVSKFWDGKPSFSFDEFMAVAQAVFSAIPYKFYYDSEWKGNWVNALLSGATNCSDGSDALIALARVFGFDGYKQHTTLKSGVGHFFAVINGRKMDTTNFQNHGSWSPLGGAGIPTRTASYRGYAGETQGKTVNITVSMDNATIYGIEDLDNRIQESVQKGLREEFNDPYTVTI